MKNAVISLIFAGVTVAVPLSWSPQQSAGPRTRDLYVSVVDGKGVAVPGLGATDFSVREDGVEREVIKAVAAAEPLSIVLLVDDSQASATSIPHLREGIRHFLELMKGRASVGIVTVGERPTSIVESTTDVGAQKKKIGRLFARPGSGAYLLEGIVEVSEGIRKRNRERAHIIALSMEGIEFSNLQEDTVLGELFSSGATLHVLAIGNAAYPSSSELRNRALVIAGGTQQTGGRREQLLTPMAIDDHLTRLSGELLNQYLVTYGRPESLLKPEKVQVSVRKPGLSARSRTRLEDR